MFLIGELLLQIAILAEICMHKNALFLLKNYKNRPALGFVPSHPCLRRPLDPQPSAASPPDPQWGGWGLRFQTSAKTFSPLRISGYALSTIR